MLEEIITREDFARLYNERYMQLYYLAFDYVHDEELSRDIVGDAFAAVWTNRERLKSDTLHSYLYVAVRNRCLDFLCKLSKKNAFEKELLNVIEIYDENEWEKREERIQRLQQELKQMPKRTQDILKERFFNDRTNIEVAKQFGISEAGIKKLITRSFNYLRKKLK